MKTIKLIVLALFLPLTFFGQTLTGLWTGSLSNDSTTVRKDQSFEVVLTQYKDKVYGYSRNEFIVNDTLYYIVKRVKGSIDGDVCEVKDDDIISYNFRGRLDKGVKVITTFRLDHNDSTWKMSGEWKTAKTKNYYSISGKADLKEEKDITKSKIFPHLEELKLADDIAFYKEAKKTQESVAAAKPEKNSSKQPVSKDNNPADIAKNETKKDVALSAKQPETKILPAKNQQSETVAMNNQSAKDNPGDQSLKENKTVAATSGETKTESFVTKEPKKDIQITATQPDPPNANKQLAKNSQKDPPLKESNTIAASSKENKTEPPVVKESRKDIQTQPASSNANKLAAKEIAQGTTTKQDISLAQQQPPAKKEPTTATSATMADQKKDAVAVAETKKPEPAEAIAKTDKPADNTKPTISSGPQAAVFVSERKVLAPQIVNFKSDSLELALYDNGEVDGDTVSVLLNGEIIMPRQGLKASAVKKTIHVSGDSVTMVLYAENLGKYPPNTGLLIIHDADETYQVRFSADFQQNAAVIFKRKRK